MVNEIATGLSGYDSIIPIGKGTIGTILKENGYGAPGRSVDWQPDKRPTSAFLCGMISAYLRSGNRWLHLTPYPPWSAAS